MKKQLSIIIVCCLVLFLILPSLSEANVTLPAIFSDHMVLQQNSEVTIWGWGKPLEQITVIGSWDRNPVQTITDNQANWQVKLTTPKAGGPYSLLISGYNTIFLQDVLIGEVWLCSGQSNMEWTPGAGIDSAEQKIETAFYSTIRFFQLAHWSAEVPQLDCHGQWAVCTPLSMKNFSAVAYFFGRELNATLNIPIGLINSSWGGTPAETWMNPEIIRENEELASAAARLTEVSWCPVKPGLAYNAMIAPLIPFKIAGVIWYQGEANTVNPIEYRDMFPALIQNWRAEWENDFPFYYVQIAPFDYGKSPVGVLVRESQLKSMSVPKTGMVVISDIGNRENIHPTNKIDVGKRLAKWALSQTYGKKNIPFSGPVYRKMEVQGENIKLFFDYAEQGMVCKGEKLTYFQIAGKDKVFVEAEAKIDGTTILVHANAVKYPVAVRFGWSNTAEPNLFNKEGLPASCFRTDGWEINFE